MYSRCTVEQVYSRCTVGVLLQRAREARAVVGGPLVPGPLLPRVIALVLIRPPLRT
jgi:hypothetical protein